MLYSSPKRLWCSSRRFSPRVRPSISTSSRPLRSTNRVGSISVSLSHSSRLSISASITSKSPSMVTSTSSPVTWSSALESTPSDRSGRTGSSESELLLRHPDRARVSRLSEKAGASLRRCAMNHPSLAVGFLFFSATPHASAARLLENRYRLVHLTGTDAHPYLSAVANSPRRSSFSRTSGVSGLPTLTRRKSKCRGPTENTLPGKI